MDYRKELYRLKLAMEEEAIKRLQVQNSKEWEALDIIVNSAKKEQIKMLEPIEDSTSRFNELKSIVLGEVLAGKSVEGFRPKYRTTNKVNAYGVFITMDSNIDTFLQLVKISQKDLNDYADAGDPEMKQALRSCIEVTKKEIVDVEMIE